MLLCVVAERERLLELDAHAVELLAEVAGLLAELLDPAFGGGEGFLCALLGGLGLAGHRGAFL